MKKNLLLFISAFLLLVTKISAQELKKIVIFNNENGGQPLSTLISDGTYLYGTTYAGGANSKGAIFRVKSDSTGFQLLYSFNGTDGQNPAAGVVLVGNYLYGTTFYGGSNNNGVVYKIKADGTDFQTLYSFNLTSAEKDPGRPHGILLNDGNVLYGLSRTGGTHGIGTIFKINMDGTGYQKLYDLGSVEKGNQPFGSLITDGTSFYFMTTRGGNKGYGNIVKINKDGSGAQDLFDFDSTTTGGAPQGDLYLQNGYLYGLTNYGGAHQAGTVFKIKTDGTGFQNIHDFDSTNGCNAQGSLIGDGTYLYGTTWIGGANKFGVIFKIKTDGSGFRKMFDMSPSMSGAKPASSLLLKGDTLYGTAQYGGSSNAGTVFGISKSSVTPVVLNYFRGNLQNGIVTLNWSTGVESNFNHFEVQKSIAKNNFLPVTNIPANGSGSSYTYSLPQSENAAEYRLKIIDNDGSSSNSGIISILQHVTNYATIHPNPVKTSFILNANSGGTLNIYNAAGKLVQSLRITTGSNTVNIGKLSNGTYFSELNGYKMKIIKD